MKNIVFLGFENQPGAFFDFGLKLTGRPTSVAGKNPYLFYVGTFGGGEVQVNYLHPSYQRLFATFLGAGNTDNGVGGYRATSVDNRLVFELVGPVFDDFLGMHQHGVVENHP